MIASDSASIASAPRRRNVTSHPRHVSRLFRRLKSSFSWIARWPCHEPPSSTKWALSLGISSRSSVTAGSCHELPSARNGWRS